MPREWGRRVKIVSLTGISTEWEMIRRVIFQRRESYNYIKSADLAGVTLTLFCVRHFLFATENKYIEISSSLRFRSGTEIFSKLHI